MSSTALKGIEPSSSARDDIEPTLSFKKNWLTKFLVASMFLGLAIDMGGDFGIRNVVLPICALLFVLTNGLSFPKGWLAAFCILVVYPAVLLLIGVFSNGDLSVATSQFKSTTLAFLLFLLVFKMPYALATKTLLFVLFSVALLAVLLAVGLTLGIDQVSEILSWMADKGGGYFGERGIDIEEIIANVYFKSTLFFVPSFVIALFSKRYLIAVVFVFALIVAISKTGMVVAGLIALIYLFFNGSRKDFFFGVISLLAILILVIKSPIYVLFYEVVTNESETVRIRIGHFLSIINLWQDNPFNFIFGFGLGSTFYSIGAEAVVSNVEIDHFNVVRKYGIFWALLFFTWVLRVSYAAIKNKHADVRALGWGLLIAFVVAGTNPVLISPLFFIFLFVTMAANSQTMARNLR